MTPVWCICLARCWCFIELNFLKLPLLIIGLLHGVMSFSMSVEVQKKGFEIWLGGLKIGASRENKGDCVFNDSVPIMEKKGIYSLFFPFSLILFQKVSEGVRKG